MEVSELVHEISFYDDVMNIHDATHLLLDQVFVIIYVVLNFRVNVILILDVKTDMVRHDLSHMVNVIILFI